MLKLFGFDKNKTFKPLKGHKGKQAVLHEYARATLGSGDIRAAVRLPEGEDENEWIATHTVDFYNTVSLLYGSIAEFCTSDTCASMTAGNKYEYLWSNPGKKPVRVSAPQYIDNVLSFVETLISNEDLFPTLPNKPFGSNFRTEVKTAFKRLFRVFAHIYYHHFENVKELGAEAHLNTCFKHFTLFAMEFNMIEKKELAPLEELINVLLPDSNNSSSPNVIPSTGTVSAVTSTPSTTSSSSSSVPSVNSVLPIGGTGGTIATLPPSAMGNILPTVSSSSLPTSSNQPP